MKKIVLLLLALLLLGGGGVVAWGWFVKKQTPMELYATLTGQKKTAVKKKKSPSTALAQIEYVKMPPIMVSIVREGSVQKHYTANIMLEVKGAATKTIVEGHIPKLKDGFFEILYNLGALPGHLDVTRAAIVKKRMQAYADSVTGKGTVRAVLIQSAFDQKV